MELINLRRRSGIIPKKDVAFGSHPHGIRCESIKITPQEIQFFMSAFENRRIAQDEIYRTLRRYIRDLAVCSTNLHNDRDEQLEE